MVESFGEGNGNGQRLVAQPLTEPSLSWPICGTSVFYRLLGDPQEVVLERFHRNKGHLLMKMARRLSVPHSAIDLLAAANVFISLSTHPLPFLLVDTMFLLGLTQMSSLTSLTLFPLFSPQAPHDRLATSFRRSGQHLPSITHNQSKSSAGCTLNCSLTRLTTN